MLNFTSITVLVLAFTYKILVLDLERDPKLQRNILKFVIELIINMKENDPIPLIDTMWLQRFSYQN